MSATAPPPATLTVCSALVVRRAPTPDGSREFLLVRTREMKRDTYRLPVGQPTNTGCRDHFDLHDAVRCGTGLRIVVGRLLVTDRVTTATGGRVHHHVLLCSPHGTDQKIRLGSGLCGYRWASEDDIDTVCVPALAPTLTAAVRACGLARSFELANGRPVGACAGV
ncbi:NUDIX hydrolase [Streptomyces chrestomyceticus]|uniref:NUDIX hydrolase n=1 Tax=Streptomyces chrestomyceticus TaxID=68185 RepID=UPI0019D25845|nr:NUDIX hydrolase [Streptomyces chrestomyceticus]